MTALGPAVAGAAAVLALACASAAGPPGGPERKTPPAVLSVSPESGETNVKIKQVEFKFDEVVSDRPSGTATELDQLFLISPRDGTPNVGWHRNRITVKPRKGFRDSTAYRITMLPGLVDLRGNVRKDGMTILFSTGSTFPPFSILGRVFDWEAEKPLNGAFIEATTLADTTIVYVTASDSSGMFDVGPLPAGAYRVRALLDQNSNRALDRNEKWDTVGVTITNLTPTVELKAIERDTNPPGIANVVVSDSVTLRITFDKFLDPTLPLQPGLFRVQRADSSEIPVIAVRPAAAYDRAKATADSVRRAAADTTRRPPPPAVQPPAGPPGLGGRRPAPPPPKPSAPPPERSLVVSLNDPLRPGRYSITPRGVRNLLGRVGEGRARGFVVAPPAPKDTTRAPADSTRRPPAAVTRPPR